MRLASIFFISSLAATPLAAQSVFDGFYLGGQIGFSDRDAGGGYRGSSLSFPGNGKGDTQDVSFGMLAGYNKTFDKWLIGAEVAANFLNSDVAEDCPNPSFSCHHNVNYSGEISGRVGYLINPTNMVYFRGGLVIADAEAYVIDKTVGTRSGQTDETLTGWTVGLGAEGVLANSNWNWRGEVKYTDFGDDFYQLDTLNGVDIDSDMTSIEFSLIRRF